MAGFFSKEAAQARKLKKLSAKAHNMFAQAPDRGYALQQLAEMGTPGAVKALLDRFEKQNQNHTVDRDEKSEVIELLINLGDKAIEPALGHLRGPSRAVHWPLRVLKRAWDDERIAQLLADLLDESTTEYTRDPERKEGLVLAAVDYHSEKLGKALVRMLDDSKESIRFLAADALLKGDYDFAGESLLKRLVEEDSGRVINRILEGAAEKDWTVTGFRGSVEGNLPEGYVITAKGTIRRRGTAAP